MVDALIKASEDQKCASAAPLPGAGRDLVPFDFEAHNQNTTSNYNSSTPLLVGVDPRLRAHQVCAPQVPTGGHAAAAAKLSNSAPLETTTNNGHHTKGNNNNSNKGKSNKNNNNNSTRNDYNEPKYAGASFTNSPDPDVVPLPSFLKTIPGAQAAMARRNSSQNSLSSSAGSSPPTTTASEQLDAEFTLPLAASTTTSAAADEWPSFTWKFARWRHAHAAATPSTSCTDTDKKRIERSVWRR